MLKYFWLSANIYWKIQVGKNNLQLYKFGF